MWTRSVVEGAATRVLVDHDRLRGLEVDGDRVVHCDAVFAPPRFVPTTELLVALGCEVDNGGWPITDGTGRTTVTGVWVAGNAANPRCCERSCSRPSPSRSSSTA